MEARKISGGKVFIINPLKISGSIDLRIKKAMARSFSSSTKGFTLIELLMTAAILAILAGAALPLAQVAVKREKEIELSRALRTIREAIDAYKKLADEKKIDFDEDTDGYPPDLETLVKGVELKAEPGKKGEKKVVRFLRKIPKDPMTNSYDWGLLSSRDKPDADIWGGENVFDIYTKSPGTALDGTKYRDW